MAREGIDAQRRLFCGNAVVGGVAAAGFLAFGAPWVRHAQAAPPGLAAVQGPPARAARRAVELLGGMKRFVHPGQLVVVKPNIGFDRVPEQAANTNPEVVAEVVRMALEAGAAEVLVFDRSTNDPKRCYRASGIAPAVAAISDRRVRVFHPDPNRFVPIDIPGALLVPRWSFYEDALRADVFINCPIAKHHVFSDLTLGMKNIMGIIGGDRSLMHEKFTDKIVDLNLGRPSHLTVLDATRILLARGPQGGSLLDVGHPGIVVAGANVVAVDAYATRFFGAQPSDIAHIHRAAKRGLGPLDPAQAGLREDSL